jgi:hypothetical protein
MSERVDDDVVSLLRDYQERLRQQIGDSNKRKEHVCLSTALIYSLHGKEQRQWTHQLNE